jgi:hypothetical protein
MKALLEHLPPNVSGDYISKQSRAKDYGVGVPKDHELSVSNEPE